MTLSMKSFSEILLPNNVSFFFSGTELKFLKIKKSEKIPFERKIRQFGVIFLYF